nr:cupin domain-containing protein [uncultured Desulfuromonas sp.]
MQHLIDRLNLIPHPEGGFYREVYRSEQIVTSSATTTQRSALTHIYFLLVRGQVSRFHRVLHDEVWNYYEGAPLRLVRWRDATIEEQCIGPDAAEYCTTIVGGDFQGAESCGDYTLVGCSVAPGFEFADFSFADDNQWLALPAPLREHYQRFR